MWKMTHDPQGFIMQLTELLPADESNVAGDDLRQSDN